MLDQEHVDRRQLRHLMAAEPVIGRLLSSGELATAAAARLRIVIDDLIDLILGP
jgi:hypothetical protein